MTTMPEKLRRAGYATHMVGKWDAGSTSPRQTPMGRGFMSFLGYYGTKNDYWTQEADCMGNKIMDFWEDDKPSKNTNLNKHEELMFMQRLKQIIKDHDPSTPLFLFYSSHLAHLPLQVPDQWIQKFAHMKNQNNCTPEKHWNCRRNYRASVNMLDEIIHNVTKLFQKKGMWDDTVMVFMGDNGASFYEGASNFPLRGTKDTWWEGGIRTPAFVGGGYLPEAARGTTRKDMVHLADWYATFAGLAGVELNDRPSPDAIKMFGVHNLEPPVDGLDMWPYFSGQITDGPRQELVFGPEALMQGKYKLLMGDHPHGDWSGPDSPNETSKFGMEHVNCSDGCLFDVNHDPGEQNDLSSTKFELVQEMIAKLKQHSRNFLKQSWHKAHASDERCPDLNGTDIKCRCWAALHVNDGYYGPWGRVNEKDRLFLEQHRGVDKRFL
jgi:arylsulfatase I/J